MSVERDGQRNSTPTLEQREALRFSAEGEKDRATSNDARKHQASALHSVSNRSSAMNSPSPRRRSRVVTYLVATLMQLAAGGLTFQLAVLFPGFAIRGMLSLLVVVVVALMFGAGPSLLATAVGALTLDLVVLPSSLTWRVPTTSQYLEIFLFLAAGCFVSIFPGRVARMRRDTEAEMVKARAMHQQSKDIMAKLGEERSRLSADEARLQAVLAAVPDRLTVFDASGTMVHLNITAQQTAGSRQGAVTIENLPEVYDLRTTSDEPFPVEELPLYRALRGEQVRGVEMRMRDAEGRDQVIQGSAAPFYDSQGQLLGVVASAHDITELRRVQLQTRHSLDALLAMAESLVAGPDLVFEPVEGAGELEPGDTLLLARSHEQFTAQQFAKLICEVLGCSRVGIIEVEAETEILRPLAVVGLSAEQETHWWTEQRALEKREVHLGDGGDSDDLADFRAGKTFIIDMSRPPFNRFPNPYGITTQLVAPMRVGDRVVGLLSLDYGGPPHLYTETETAVAGAIGQLGAMLLERERLLRDQAAAQATVLSLLDSTRRMDEFLGVASHELKTPLTTTSANAQFMERRLQRLKSEVSQLGDETEAALLPFIQPLEQLTFRVLAGTRRQTRLIEDLLTVSCVQAGKLELRSRECDLLELVRESVEEQRLQQPERRITFCTSLDHLGVLADADRVAQVVTNYLTNALKYSSSACPVAVSIEEKNGLAYVRVRDKGPGLTAVECEQIWDRFHRVPGIEVQSGSGVGLGLGLYISRTIIEMQGGQVGVESAPQKGSTFWFALPLLPSA